VTRRTRVAIDAVTGSWAARLYLAAVVIAFIVGIVADATTPPEDGASFGFLYLLLVTLPWSFLLPGVLSASSSSEVAPWSILACIGLGAVLNALAITLVSRRIGHVLRPPGSPVGAVTYGGLPRRLRLAFRLAVGSWPARVYLGLVAVAYGYGVVSQFTGDGTGFIYVALITLPWGMVPIPGEWQWALLPATGGLINAAFITVLTQVRRAGSAAPLT
jgi:hypothetical protein